MYCVAENQGQKCQWSEETAGSAAGSAEGGGDGRTPSQDVRQNPFVRIIDQADAVKLTGAMPFVTSVIVLFNFNSIPI